MRYSNIRKIKNPVQHEIKDIASAWGLRSTSPALLETQKRLSWLYTKGPPRLFGWLQLQEITHVPWSGGGCVWISFGLDPTQDKYQMEMRYSSALLQGNARSRRRCQGAWGRAVCPSACAGRLHRSAVLEGQWDTLFRPGSSIMWLHGFNVDGALVSKTTHGACSWLPAKRWEAASTCASPDVGGDTVRHPKMAWSCPVANSWHQLWVTGKPHVCQIDLSNPAAFHTHHSGLSQSAKVRLGSPCSSKALSLWHSSSSKKDFLSQLDPLWVPLSERRPRTGIQGRWGQIPCPLCQKPSATGIRHHCQLFTGQELRLISPDEQIWTCSHGSYEQLGGTKPGSSSPVESHSKPRGGQHSWSWGTMRRSCQGTAVVRQHCRFPFPPCLFRQSAGMSVCNRKGLKTTKKPQTALLFCGFVNDTLASSQYNKI